MNDTKFRRESATEYFKELVEGTLVRQHVSAGEPTAYYVVCLLAGFLRRSAENEIEPLALKFVAALESTGGEQRATLKQIGDVSLFVSGFFSDSLRRKLVDVDYYVALGGYAYNALSRCETSTFSPVFAELSDKFVAFVDVLSEISERTACTTSSDLLRLYEKWLRTGSRHSEQLLVERGILPSVVTRFDLAH